ncbi:MAG: hypothetical protein NTW46_03850 [Candidatus Nealsonbacteria bacterium]|nr:hypothetical protein [Candidatus Nealsonbacteria bacterium]
MKITKHQLKNLLKNGYLFKSLLFNRKTDFVVGLTELLKKWPSSFRKNELGWVWGCKDYKDASKKRSIASSQRIKFLKSLKEKGEFKNFCADIYDFLKKYSLSIEWSNSIIDLVVSAWFFPPLRNLDISSARRVIGQKKIFLILNHDTSLKDIEDAWPEVRNKQKELWSNSKKTNITKKSFINLDVAIKDLKKRYLEGMENFNEGELKKYKITDLDIAGGIWEDEEDISEETDKKRKDNLRQIRKRFKEK